MDGGHDVSNDDSASITASSLFTGKLPIEAALNELRLRLLDLTGRNRLINFRHTTGKSLQFVHTSIDGVFRRLMTEQTSRITIASLPEPGRNDWINCAGRLARPEPKEYAVRVGIDPSYDLNRPSGRDLAASTSGSQARTLFYAEDLGKHCRKLEREAKLAIEETGANMLYLVLGFLEFPEAPDSEKLLRAPLLCVPVLLTRTDEERYSSFHISHTGEELADNLSLREKVKRDFGLNLPEYEDESSVEAYFDAVSDAIATQPNWRVRRMMTLALLSFANMLLVRDLDPNNWPDIGNTSALLSHPLVRQVFEGRPSSAEGTEYADEYAIDEHPKRDIPLIYDADSSQHSALIDVLEGQNRVIEGPPGTGKSQTITNLIAAALHSGKKVLFVAEKLAALEVVRSRLTLAGLDPFVLELHSNKANKKRVLADLAARISLRTSARDGLSERLERHEEKRRELKAYADLMNSRVGNNLELTLQQVMWRAERHRLSCADCADAVHHLLYPAAPRTTPKEFADICDRLRYLAAQLQSIGTYGVEHQLWGFFPTEFKPQDDLPIGRLLREFAQKFSDFSAAIDKAAELLGGANLNMSAKSSEQLLSVLAELVPASTTDVDFALLPALFPEADSQGQRSLATLQDIGIRANQLADAEADVRHHLLSASSIDEHHASEATSALAALTALSLGECDLAQLSPKKEALQRSVDHALASLAGLQGTAGMAKLRFEGRDVDVHRVKAVADCVASAPIALLHMRHEGLRGPASMVCLQHTKVKLLQLVAKRSQLGAFLYLDAVPDDSELSAAILTFREGHAWYRVFQRRWREAKALHRRLEQSKSKKTAIERQRDLEDLRDYQRARASIKSDAALSAAAGPSFKGEETPIAELYECAKWIEQCDASLERVGVQTLHFDVLNIERQLLSHLAVQVPTVNAAVDALTQFEVAAGALLHSAVPRVREGIASPRWSVRIETAEHAVAVLGAAESLLAQFVRPAVSADVGLRSMMMSRQVADMAAALENHIGGRALLGEKFRGRLTNVETALAAHVYGRMVKSANLPRSIEQALISHDCSENYSRLTSYIEEIREGWKATADFSEAMAKFGRFELSLWANATGRSTSEYVRELAEHTTRATVSLSGLLVWAQYVCARSEATRLGLQDFVVPLESGAIPAEKFEHAFVWRFYASVAQGLFDSSVMLRQFSGVRHSNLRSDFAMLDREIIKLRGRSVAYECRRQSSPPPGNHSARVGEKTEMKLLEHLIPLQRPGVPVRQMLKRAGQAIQELKPCFMMGPQAVAQFLEPGHLHFDLVVMDEASQLRPEEAIGAVARGSQLVVVGDPKQLPPTSFFSRMSLADGDDDGMGQMATSEAESILDVCISHFQPVRTLRWHYRSRHESLIAFSNHHFYRGGLLVFPSPYPKSKALGLRYQYVADGVYENQMNQVEARRVVDAVVDHILSRPQDSLGIVTLNIKQRDLVAELLEDRLRSLPEAVDFKERWDVEGMGLFIKNLENVQGDERDTIFISTTFGRSNGVDVVRQNFGPISREGGWRRLNVLFTRARKSVTVFSSMRPEEIVIDARTPEGTKALRNYLEYARTGVLPVEKPTGLPPDSDFEIAVMDVLRQKGYEVEPQLGVAGFRIDIAVKHPAHYSGYLAAIECDGASYHSGVSVRDRDRIRQEILESLGWKDRIWRIWSTDWFRNPLAEIEKLLQFLTHLQNKPLPDEYVVSDDGDSIADVDLTESATLEVVEGLVFGDEEEDLEIEVGDLVSYAPTDALDKPISVRLTLKQTNVAMGLVAENTPLGAVLMGATAGEAVVLRVPGQPLQSYVILSIKRAAREPME